MNSLLTHLRNASKAYTSGYEVSLSIKEVREIVGMLDAQAARITRISSALEELITSHSRLVGSGDCGNWDVDEEPEMIEARAALDALDGPSPPSEVAEFVGHLENTPKPSGEVA